MRAGHLATTFAAIMGMVLLASGEEAPPTGRATEAQDQVLTVTATTTFGYYGPPRAAKAVVCDKVDATLKISGLAHDAEGKVDFSLRTEVLNAAGESVLKSPWNRETFAQDSAEYYRSAFFRASDRLDAEKAGVYRWRHEVEDHVSGKKTSCEIPVELFVPSGLGIIALQCGHTKKPDGVNDSSGTAFLAGELMYVHAGVVNFAVDDGRAKLIYKVEVLDRDGKPTDWPSVGSATEQILSRYEDPKPLGFQCQLNALHPGKYILRVRVDDLVGGTGTTEYLPLLVTEMPDWTLDAEQIAKLKEQAESEKKSR